MSKMSKPWVIVGCAALAAAMTTSVSTAEAGKHRGGGFRHHHRHVYIAPVYKETYRVVRKPPVQQPQPKVAVIRYDDGSGRVYDVASKTWHDGQNRCWSGKLGWSFKNGAWNYGNFRWYEADGTWRTNAPQAPQSVACESSAAFAGKVVPTVGQANGQKEMAGNAEKAQSGEPAQLALPGDGKATSAGQCKKYFPSVGEMLPVPCANDRSSL